MQALQWYDRQLAKNPIVTKTLTSAVLFGLGDVIAQVCGARRLVDMPPLAHPAQAREA